MSYDNFESSIASFLYATKSIPEGMDIVKSDFGIPVNPDGTVSFELELKRSKPFKPTLVVDNTQLGLDL